MAERSEERTSISSSLTEADTLDNEKNGSTTSPAESFIKLKAPEELEIADDVERAELLPHHEELEIEEEKAQPTPETSTRTAVLWMVVNTLATIGIVRHASLELGIRRAN